MSAVETKIAYNKLADIPLNIATLAGRIGAEIRGIDLGGSLGAATVVAIRNALLRHKVVFFRDQSLDDKSHENFAARLGRPFVAPTLPIAQGTSYLLALDSVDGFAASSWHTDLTFVDVPPAISILRAITLPQPGGDTLWANTAIAYEGLPPPLKKLVDGLWAVHSNEYDYAQLYFSAEDRERVETEGFKFAATTYEAEHPVVRVHSETGELSLLLGDFVKRFVGLNRFDSQRLFAVLQDHITKPENTVRWCWRLGDVAMWDNRATQHRAIADFDRQRRTMRRATLAGDRSVAPDGKYSRQIKPAPAKENQRQ